MRKYFTEALLTTGAASESLSLSTGAAADHFFDAIVCLRWFCFPLELTNTTGGLQQLQFIG